MSGAPSPDRYDGWLAGVAAAPTLLVALDFDGVLSQIVPVPSDARLVPGAAEAVGALTTLPGVTVAAVSGRALADLRAVSGLGDPVLLVGSHGAERDLPGHGAAVLTEAEGERLAAVRAGLEDIAAGRPGVEVEVKPTAAVLHTRRAAREDAEAATRLALEGPGALDGVHVTPGKEVVEIAVVEAGKGVAVSDLRELVGADAVVYVGDDVTDESVFQVLGQGDLSVKVGEGETAARRRVDGPADVVRLLERLAALRATP